MSSRTASTPRRAPCLCLVALLGGGLVHAETLTEVLGAAASSADKGIAAQLAADRVADDTAALAGEYATIQRQLDGLAVYNARLERQIAEQEQRLADIERASEDATRLAREIPPLLEHMVDSLESFVALDKPFQLEARRARIADLRARLDRSDIPVAASFRAVLEAYLAELDHAQELASTHARVEIDGAPLDVVCLQLGRLALFAQSEDGSRTLMWDDTARRWFSLDDADYARAITTGIRIARGELPDALLRLPLPAAATP